ncbi:hypothetical protein TWF730_003649 [Orbilia blumenaviensis]|uniref:Uncharacterized protein n=1 Tax=Orbilia blumenaviensis TaxID=1796055 RepID=A0AAV9U779_9PEZI
MFSVARDTNESLKGDVVRILVGDVTAPSDLPEETPIIEGVATVSSYNWLAEHEVDSVIPTIQVPGAPPILAFPETSATMKLQPDVGHHYVDQNAARMKGKSGMIPGLAACHAYKRDFKVTDYDVITDRNNLIKLYELIELAGERVKDEPPISTPWRAPSIQAAAARRGRGNYRPVHPFFQQLGPGHGRGIESMDRRAEATRIDVDVVSGYDNDTGKYIYDENAASTTLMLTRWEPHNEEIVISSMDFRGFGHSFLTKTRLFLSLEDGRMKERGPKDVTGFHCLVEYKLFGMKFLVRYHADACDMTRAEFVQWISKDGLRDLAELDTESNNDSDDGSEDRTLCESPDTDTFELLDAFKTLTVKTDEVERIDQKIHLSPKNKTKDASESFRLPNIPLEIINTPNTIFPGNKIIQVKTRGRRTGLNVEKLYVQLFFSQTENFMVAYHTRGIFSAAETLKEEISPELEKWGSDNKERLKRLVSIMREIKAKVVGLGQKGALEFRLKKKASDDPVIIDIRAREDKVDAK